MNIIIIIIIKSLINSAALRKLRRAAGICHSVLRSRCAFRCRAKVVVDSDERQRSVGRLFQMSGPEIAKFLRPMVVAVRCTLSLPEAADLRCRRPASSTTGWQSSARYGSARPRSLID